MAIKWRKANIEFVLALLGLGCWLSAPVVGVQRQILKWIHLSDRLTDGSEGLTIIFFGLGLIFLGTALYGLAGLALGRKGLAETIWGAWQRMPGFLADVFQEFCHLNSAISREWVWVIPVIMIGIGACAYFLSQPMRGDEAFTFLNYVNGSFGSLFDYSAPNNHVLHTLLVKLSVFVFGAEPASIRIPAFLAGIGSFVLVFYLGYLRGRTPGAGMLAALGTATFPYLILYSTNARGYTLIVFLFLALALSGMRFVKTPSRAGVFILGFLSSAAMLVMPSAIIGLAGIYLWIVCLLLLNKTPIKWVVLNFTFLYGLVCSSLTFLFYMPVILVSNGVKPIFANNFVKPLPWNQFFTQIIPHLQDSFVEITRDVPLFVLAVGAIFFAGGILFAIKKKDWGTLLLLPSLLMGGALVITLRQQIPYARAWIYFVPFTLILVDYGFVYLIQALVRPYQTMAKMALLAGGFIFALSLMSNNVIAKYPDTSAFPEAPIVAQYLKPILTENDAIRVTNTANVPVYFYLWYYNLPQNLPSATTTGRTFLVVKKSRYSIETMTDKPVIKLLDIGDMALYELDKR